LQTRLYKKDGVALNHDPNILKRTQDLDPVYEENSNLYLFTRESFAQTNARIGKNPILFETPKMESVDIDDEHSWVLALALANIKMQTQHASRTEISV
jgi:CMP-N-acetylneuraminic acid synthetase